MNSAYHGFPRQKYCSRLPFPSSGDLPDPGMETVLCLAGGFFTTEPPGKLFFVLTNYHFPHLTCQKTLPDLGVQIFSKMDSNSEAYGKPWHHWFWGLCPLHFGPPRTLSAYVQCLPCTKDGKYVTSWYFSQTGFSPSLPCHNCYLKLSRGSRDYLCPIPVMDVTGDRSKVQCSKEQYCIGTWNVRSMNQGKLKVVKKEMARVSVDILRISELKWTGMGEFNSHDHYIYYCGQESLRRNGVAIIVNERV